MCFAVMGLLLSFLSLRQSPYCQNSTCVSSMKMDDSLSGGGMQRRRVGERRRKNAKKRERDNTEVEKERQQRKRGKGKERLMGFGGESERGRETWEWDQEKKRLGKLGQRLRRFLCRMNVHYVVFPVWVHWPWTKTKIMGIFILIVSLYTGHQNTNCWQVFYILYISRPTENPNLT